MAKKLVVYIVSILTVTLLALVMNKMILLAVSSFLPVSELTVRFCHAVFGCIAAVISIYYGFDMFSLIDRNADTEESEDKK